MDRPIGEVFEFRGVHLMVVPVASSRCFGCFLWDNGCTISGRIREIFGECYSTKRSDKRHVIFAPVEDL